MFRIVCVCWVVLLTNHESVANESRQGESANELENDINVHVGRECGADARQEKKLMAEQHHEAAAKPAKKIGFFFLEQIQMRFCVQSVYF